MNSDERRTLMRKGFEAFNRGEFFEAHEFWEEVWDVVDDPERTWIQGLIQIATGLHKLARGRSDICEKLLRRALTKLDGAADALDGIDLAHAIAEATRILQAIGRGEVPEAKGIRLRGSY